MPEQITYCIMHQNDTVADINTVGLCRVYNASFLPYDLVLEPADDFDTRLNNLEVFWHWCSSRMLTLDRQYSKELLNSIKATQDQTDKKRAQIALSYHCLTLTDVFWVKQSGETMTYDDINLYYNHLDNSFVDISLRGRQMTVTNSYLIADNLSVGGSYPKAWYRKANGFYLYKDGGADVVCREVLASKVARCFDCHQVIYEYGIFDGQAVSESCIMTSLRYSIVTYEAFDLYCLNRGRDTLSEIIQLDAHGYYMMNIIDYLIGNTDRHWQNWGVLVDNTTNKPVRLHDLMDFNKAFHAYDSLDGAGCLTTKERITQREAAEQAVNTIGLNQIAAVDDSIFQGQGQYLPMFKMRFEHLKRMPQSP